MNCCDYLTDQSLSVVGEANGFNYTNVACGQVFVCSGQSNMELPLSYVLGGAEEIATADRPNWRFFRVPHTPAATPQDDMAAEDPDTKLPARWLVSNSTNAARFSAVCYLTAKHIAEMLWSDAPFGLIWASWGGTRVEAWAPAAANKAACPSAAAMPPMAGPQEYSVLYNGMIHPLTKYSIRGRVYHGYASTSVGVAPPRTHCAPPLELVVCQFLLLRRLRSCTSSYSRGSLNYDCCRLPHHSRT